jgi:hypothetical protein
MTATFKSQFADDSIIVPDALLPFFRWLAIRRDDDRAISMLMLLASHDIEASADKRAEIRRSLIGIMEDAPV